MADKRLAGDTRPVFVEVRGAFGYDVDAVSDKYASVPEGDSLTLQSQADEADINTIVRRFGITGQLPQVDLPPTFADFGDHVFDYQSAQNMILEADASFMALSADIRYRFMNDPQRFVEFCSNPENLDEMRKMGLAVPPKVVEHIDVPVTIVKEGDDGKQGDSKSGVAPKGAGKRAPASGESD